MDVGEPGVDRLPRAGQGRPVAKAAHRLATGRQRAASLTVAALIVVPGCSPAPSQTILGSYFPSWMVCALAGLGATVVIRQVFAATGLGRTLPAPLVVYLALVVAFSFATWLIWLD